MNEPKVKAPGGTRHCRKVCQGWRASEPRPVRRHRSSRPTDRCGNLWAPQSCRGRHWAWASGGASGFRRLCWV